MTKADNRKKSILEAALFTMGESVEVAKLAELIEEDEEKTRKLLDVLKAEYEEREGGMTITELGDAFQMCTSPKYYEQLLRIVKAPKKYNLTEAILETLSIVAYKQPVTKAEIDKIRGVSCEHVVNHLIELDLIGEVGRKEAPGRPILLGTTEQFLRSFGVKSLTDLPVLGADTRARFMEEAELEAGLESVGTEENPVTVGV